MRRPPAGDGRTYPSEANDETCYCEVDYLLRYVKMFLQGLRD